MIRRPPRSTLFPYTNALPISSTPGCRFPSTGGLRMGKGDPRTKRGKIYRDRKSTRLNSSHGYISYAVFCLKKKKKQHKEPQERVHKRVHKNDVSVKSTPHTVI